MNMEKIFWIMIVVVIAGFFVLLTTGFAFAQTETTGALNTGSGSAGAVAYGTAGLQQAPSYGAQTQGGAQGGVQGGAQNVQGGTQGGAQTGTQGTVNANGVQEISLSMQNGAYSTLRAKKGVPVRIVADMNTLRGCSRTVVFPEFGIRKTLSAGDNIIEFTPTKSGTFDFTCGMGMYRGKFIVEETDGSVAAYTGSVQAPIGSCGGSGGSGGCGCGG